VTGLTQPRRTFGIAAVLLASLLKAAPTALVLEHEGRVASRILGQLPDESVLSTLIRKTLEESAN
jgi:hypothetical protein